MKKQFLIIPAIALLASCGGGQQNQNGGNASDTAAANANADGGDGRPSVSTTTEPDELTLLTCELLKFVKHQTDGMRLKDEPDTALNVNNITDYPRYTLDSPDPATSRKDSSRFYVHLDGGFDNVWEFTYKKRKSGGFWVLVHLNSLSGDYPDCERNEYMGIYYVDGRKDLAFYGKGDTDYALPQPTVTDFYANSDQFPESVVVWMKDSQKTKLEYSIVNDKIEVTLNPYQQIVYTNDDYEEIIDILPKNLMGFEKKKDPKFPTITYVWNGDGYVIDPKYKPQKEDLKYFEGSNEKFSQSGKYPIQLYAVRDDDQISTADINGDGIEDLVINDNDYKEFAVYFKDKKGVYNRQMIGKRPPEDDDEGELTASADKGGIIVSAFYESEKTYDFRYEKGDFYLYNYSQSMEWPDDGGSEYYEIDFVKHKVIDNDTTYSVPAYPLKKISEVPLGWWTITEIYSGCNMIDVWKQLESRPDDAEGGKALKYSLDNLKYGIDVNDGHCTRERTVHCYELKNEKNGYLVVDVYGLMCETQSGTYNLSENTITQYIFKDGKLTKTELQDELKPYSKDGYQTVFENERGYGYYGYKLHFLSSGGDETVFVWNGEKFEKK